MNIFDYYVQDDVVTNIEANEFEKMENILSIIYTINLLAQNIKEISEDYKTKITV